MTAVTLLLQSELADSLGVVILAAVAEWFDSGQWEC